MNLVSTVFRRSILVTARPRLVAKSSSIPYESKVLSPDDDRLDEDWEDPDPPSAPEGSSYAPPQTPGTSNPITAVRVRAFQPLKYRLHVHSTRNNTITTFTRPDGGTVAWFSGGSCGFKKGNRASYEAGYQCAVKIFERITKEAEAGRMVVELFFKGFGQGREALYRALLSTEGESVRPLVVSITDRTPIKIGGTRAPKMRRL